MEVEIPFIDSYGVCNPIGMYDREITLSDLVAKNSVLLLGPRADTSEDVQSELEAYVGVYLKEEIQAEALTRNVPAFSKFLEVMAFQSGGQITSLVLRLSIARQEMTFPVRATDWVLVPDLLGRTTTS